MHNDSIIEKVVEITTAKLTGNDTSTNQSTGKATAELMQVIYDKLVL